MSRSGSEDRVVPSPTQSGAAVARQAAGGIGRSAAAQLAAPGSGTVAGRGRLHRAACAAMFLVAAAWLAWGLAAPRPGGAAEEEHVPASVALGERLFLETRFAQHFAVRCGGDVNSPSVRPDPVMAAAVGADGRARRGAFRAASMNCRQCHLVDEHRRATPGGTETGVRTYSDFASRSPVPAREDGQTTTLRNSPSLVAVARRRGVGSPLLHFDGEFGTPEELVVATWTGRNFGWLADERPAAIRHIARVLREDDGRGELAHEFGGAYSRLLGGTSSGIEPEFRLTASFRIDVSAVSDEALVRAAARLVAAYMRGIDFARDRLGRNVGSPYDRFLALNGLPRAPGPGETEAAYAGRLRRALERLREPRLVDGRDGAFALHRHAFAFGPEELRGLRVFLRREPGDGGAGGTGNCVACHAPPRFTDHRFHDTGVSQFEYDAVHGAAAFAALEIPDLATRNSDPGRWLPPTHDRPGATGALASVPRRDDRSRADLGLWAVLFDPARPGPQGELLRVFRSQFADAPDDATLLARAIGAFKTPSLRDLGQSAPYMHDGGRATLRGAVAFYAEASSAARSGRLRNGDPELARIAISDDDASALVAFLRSLDEDYE